MQLTYESSNNTLRLTLEAEQPQSLAHIDLPGYVEMGTGGRLAGIELLDADQQHDLPGLLARWQRDELAGAYLSVSSASAYLELSESDDPHEPTRAAPATFRADLDGDGRLLALSIPRHGVGYEITYPSGNQ